MNPTDRRSSTRYVPAADQARVGWWEGVHFRTAAARLTDISVGGAAVTVDPPAFQATTVWVCLVDQSAPEWVEADSAGSITETDGAQRLRLAFTHSCPYEVFKAAVWGDLAAPAAPPARPDAEPPTERPPEEIARRDDLNYVVLSSSVEHGPPTLQESWLARRAERDRMAVLPWAVAMAMGLATVALLGVLVLEHLGRLRLIASLLRSAGD